MGYSLYDTVIVFDRIRENVPRMPRATFSQIANRSMSEVFTRSLATSFVVLMPVGSLLLFGGETLKDFAFALLVGVLSGAYSSIFIATPVLVEWKEREQTYMRRRRLMLQEHGGHIPAFATGTLGEPAPAVAPRSRRPRGRGGRARARRPRGSAEPRQRAPGTPQTAARRAASAGGTRLRPTTPTAAARPARGQPTADAAGAAAPPPERAAGAVAPRRAPRSPAAPAAPTATARKPPSPSKVEAPAEAQKAREALAMAMVVWVMMGIAVWHFTVFLPDRFWGGIVGAFVAAFVGAVLVRLPRERAAPCPARATPTWSRR